MSLNRGLDIPSCHGGTKMQLRDLHSSNPPPALISHPASLWYPQKLWPLPPPPLLPAFGPSCPPPSSSSPTAARPLSFRLLPTAAPLRRAGSWPVAGGITLTWAGRPTAGLRCSWWSSGSSRTGPSTSCPRSIGRGRTGGVGGSSSAWFLLLLLGGMRPQAGLSSDLSRLSLQRGAMVPGCRRSHPMGGEAVGPGCGWGTAAAECCTWCTTGSASMSKW